MQFTMQNQHFHRAKLISLFWAHKIQPIRANKNEPRNDLVSMFEWENYIKRTIIEKNKTKKTIVNLNNFVKKYQAENTMASYLIFKETEDNIQVNQIEEDFADLCEYLLTQEEKFPKFILNYKVQSLDEREKILRYFCLQIARSPDNYVSYLNMYFANKIITDPNPYLFNLFDLRNVENMLQIMNQAVLKNFQNSLKHFKNYSFEIIENQNGNNMLTDNTVIPLNHNNFFKILFKENFNQVENIVKNIYIFTINEKYCLFFYPNELKEQISVAKHLYFKNQFEMYMLYSRNIIVHESKKEDLLENVQKFINNKLNNDNQFLKYYIHNNFLITNIEEQIKKYYELHKIGIDFGWQQIS